MTPTETALLEVLKNLTIAVGDLQYAQHTASKILAQLGEDSPSAYQRDLEAYLQTAAQQLKTVHSLLSQLGVRL